MFCTSCSWWSAVWWREIFTPTYQIFVSCATNSAYFLSRLKRNRSLLVVFKQVYSSALQRWWWLPRAQESYRASSRQFYLLNNPWVWLHCCDVRLGGFAVSHSKFALNAVKASEKMSWGLDQIWEKGLLEDGRLTFEAFPLPSEPHLSMNSWALLYWLHSRHLLNWVWIHTLQWLGRHQFSYCDCHHRNKSLHFSIAESEQKNQIQLCAQFISDTFTLQSGRVFLLSFWSKLILPWSYPVCGPVCITNHRFFLSINNFSPLLLTTGANQMYRESFSRGDQEPWVFRGGLQAEFQVCMWRDDVAVNLTCMFCRAVPWSGGTDSLGGTWTNLNTWVFIAFQGFCWRPWQLTGTD